MAICPYGEKIFFIFILSLYIGKRFFAFLQEAFLGNASGKRRISFEKTFRAWATLPCARTGGRKIFVFFDYVLIYIGRGTWQCALLKRIKHLHKKQKSNKKPSSSPVLLNPNNIFLSLSFIFLNFTYYVCKKSYCRYFNWYNFI